MIEKNKFEFNYCYAEQEEIKKLREKYIDPETKEQGIDRLRRLDGNVTRKAMTYSLIIGIVGMLLLGLGMSFIMSDFGQIFGNKYVSFAAGIITGLPGVFMIIVACPIYYRTLRKERKKIAPEIIRISDELLKK